jgi:hypothetical protein
LEEQAGELEAFSLWNRERALLEKFAILMDLGENKFKANTLFPEGE